MQEFDVKAEIVLAAKQMKPESLIADCEGHFRRGYASDLVDLNSKGEVGLGRPGVRHFIPEGLFFNEEYLRDASNNKEEQKQRSEELKYNKELWHNFFKPFDTLLFRKGYAFHLEAYELLHQRDAVLSALISGISMEDEHDSYVRQLATLLLIPSLKGNVDMLGFYVSAILGERVETEKLWLAPDVDHKSVLYTTIRFTVIIEGLTTTEYRRRMERYDPFFSFLQHWFLPYDCDCHYAIKDRTHPFVLGDSLTLDYNTRF